MLTASSHQQRSDHRNAADCDNLFQSFHSHTILSIRCKYYSNWYIHAYKLYCPRIARIRNGWFLAEILSDITRKKAATPEIGAAVIWLEPKAVYKIKARKAHDFNRGMKGRTL